MRRQRRQVRRRRLTRESLSSRRSLSVRESQTHVRISERRLPLETLKIHPESNIWRLSNGNTFSKQVFSSFPKPHRAIVCCDSSHLLWKSPFRPRALSIFRRVGHWFPRCVELASFAVEQTPNPAWTRRTRCTNDEHEIASSGRLHEGLIEVQGRWIVPIFGGPESTFGVRCLT